MRHLTSRPVALTALGRHNVHREVVLCIKALTLGVLRVKMSHVVCPLCGKSAAIDSYDPSEFEDDVSGQTFRGKGRGKGFEVSEKFSVLGDQGYDDLLQRMASRALRIVKMLCDNGYLDKQEIIDTFSESE